MSNAIEKIGVVNPNDSNIRYNKGKKFPSYIKVNADVEIELKAFKSEKAGGNRRPKWIAKPQEKGPFTSKDQSAHTGDIMGAKVEAKFCGPQIYHVEAYTGEPSNKYPNRILIQGYAPEKIVLAEWRTSKDGASIGSKRNKFGDDIWLHLKTEGLNGARLRINVYNDQWGSDGFVDGYTAKCYGGEVNLNIKNTYKWRSKTGLMVTNGEQFYVKIKVVGKNYAINDGNGKKEIAKYVVFDSGITKRTTEKSTSDLPVKIDQNEIDLERYEPCRFKKISITDEGNEIELFEEGKLKIDENKKKQFAVSEKIFFDFDKSNIKAGAREVLDGIAEFLLDSPFVPVTLGAHCDSRGDHKYNDPLSYRRAQASVDYLVSKGVSSTRITAKGYGKRRPYVKGENLSEAQHQLNRRVTIQFNIFGGDAESIIVSAIAADVNHKKDFKLKVEDYNVQKCLRRDLTDEHDDKVHVVELTRKGRSDPYECDKANVDRKIYSDSTKYKLAPLDFIFPHKVSPNQFLYYINSCRYYSNKQKPTVVLNVFPDIKWDFHFYLNLSNSLSVNSQATERTKALGYRKFEQLQKKAVKLGVEKGSKRTDIDFGAILVGNWNKSSQDKYHDVFNFTAKFDARIEQLYEIFSQLRDVSSIITKKTKSKTTKVVGKKMPFGVEVVPPNFSLGAEWKLARAVKNSKKTKDLGTYIKFYFKAKPLIGLDLTLDLLQMAIGATGPAAPILSAIRYWLDDDDQSLSIDLFVNLIVFGKIEIPNLQLSYNTASDNTDPDRKVSLDAAATVGLRFEAGILVKAKMVVMVAEFYAKAEAKVQGEGSITFGHGIMYQNGELTYRPEFLFDGLIGKVVIKAEVGLSIKAGWLSVDRSTKLEDFEEEYNLIKPFDIVKSLENLSGKSATITLLK